VPLIRTYGFVIAGLLLAAQAASVGHLVLARHSVCAESGHLVEGVDATPGQPVATDTLGTGERSDAHCVVVDAAQAPAVLAQSLVFVVVQPPEVELLGTVRPGWTRNALVDAPKASPPQTV
jgi:hypothetical protein